MLEIRLLGAPEVRRHDRGGAPTRLRPAEVELLAFVALQQGRPVPRDLITAALWHEGADLACRHRLNTALWRLRAGIEEDLPRGTYLRSDRGSVLIDLTDVQVDVTTFEQATSLSTEPGQLDVAGARALRRAVDGYHGDLLEGLYSEWIVRERERLLGRYLGALSQLLQWHLDRDDVDAAIATGLQVLDRDPLREDVHRILIRCFGRLGARSRAIEQYRTCRTLLQGELGIEPMAETTAAVAAVAGWQTDTPRSATRRPVPAAAVLSQLHGLRAQVQEMAAALDAAIDQLEG